MRQKNQINLKGYGILLDDIKAIMENGLIKAYQAVDNLKLQTYWQIGERIVREELQHKERADYGKKLISNLVIDLSLKRDALYKIVQFYKYYPIVVTVSRQLSWSHYLELIKLKNKERRKFYEIQTINENWSVRELRKRIKDKEYEKAKKTGKLLRKFPPKLPSPEEVFKDSYNWDFISLEEKHTEKELENALLDNIQKLLLEFGSGFAFLSRQQKLLINDQWHKIDLLFYHILLKCHIIVELKARGLKPGDLEQATKYLTYFREKKLHGDRDPIALIICKSHDKIDIYYSAGKNRDDIFIAEYKTKLPKENELKKQIEAQSWKKRNF